MKDLFNSLFMLVVGVVFITQAVLNVNLQVEIRRLGVANTILEDTSSKLVERVLVLEEVINGTHGE